MRRGFIGLVFPFIVIILLIPGEVFSARILLPMDKTQSDHLKAYGLTYWVLENGQKAEWLLNYRGGSFSLPYAEAIEKECKVRGVSYKILAEAQYKQTIKKINKPDANMDNVKLEKAPEIAVYSPKSAKPWDDAVTLALTYAEIPYDVVYDNEVMDNKLSKYDWLHLHHEDFTGQFGKFWAHYRNADWYKKEVKEDRNIAAQWGFDKVSKLKLAVSKKIRDFTLGGGYLFAMCSAPDTYDIALSAEGVDICKQMFDGDPMDPNAQEKIDYSNTFAFQGFDLVKSPYRYEYSNIDGTKDHERISKSEDFFKLFKFSAKWDPVPTMLCQNHERLIHGFFGQTTSFRKEYLKPEVLVMGENVKLDNARYIHGQYGKGMWTFYSGHDPEDYKHMVNEPPTDLKNHPNSPGYRLILNNILFPAAKKKKKET